MKKIQAYKHISHKTDSNKAYFILQFLQFWLKLAYFAIFANFRNFLQFSCNFEQFLVQFLQFLTIQNVINGQVVFLMQFFNFVSAILRIF